MAAPDLTFEQVRTMGMRATIVSAADSATTTRRRTYRAWLFDGGRVWLIHRDDQRVFSMRRAAAAEVPRHGWHHDEGCTCRYCAAASRRAPTGRAAA